MKTHRYYWESVFYVDASIASIHGYDAVSQNLGLPSWEVTFSNQISTNRSSELMRTISYVNLLAPHRLPYANLEYISNHKKTKEKENKFKLLTFWSFHPSVAVYLYFFYLVKIFSQKNIRYSHHCGATTYNTNLTSLNNTLKIGSDPLFNEIEPLLGVHFSYQNRSASHLFSSMLKSL